MTWLLVVLVSMVVAEVLFGLFVLGEYLGDVLAGRRSRSLWRTGWQAEEELRRVSEDGRRAMREAVHRHQWGGR